MAGKKAEGHERLRAPNCTAKSEESVKPKVFAANTKVSSKVKERSLSSSWDKINTQTVPFFYK